MKILIINTGKLPVYFYGGTERVIWYLGKELKEMGHEITFMVEAGSSCDFARVIPIDPMKEITEQIPKEFDVVHFNFIPAGIESCQLPYIITLHGNINNQNPLDRNTVFVSANHAQRFGSKSFVHNGLDWNDYQSPELTRKRSYFHFLGKAAWRVKNLRGAIDVIKKTRSEKLKVLGGVRFNFSMGLRFTFNPRISFVKQVGGNQKSDYLNNSRGLLFPVRWHEPFGLAIIESLFYGCPVFGTTYGSLPELVGSDVGFLSNSTHQLASAIAGWEKFSPVTCSEYARENFNSKKMAAKYLEKYEQVIRGGYLNAVQPSLRTVQQEKFLAWQ